MRFFPQFALTLLCALLPLAVQASFSPEQQLKTAVDQLRAGHNNEAFQQLEKLVKQEPNFRLAQLIYGELLAVRSGANSKLAGNGDAQLKDLLEEAQLRLSPPVKLAGSLPSLVLQVAKAQKYLVVVDLSSARLYLLENLGNELKVLREHYAAMGRNGAGKSSKGDLRTPIGIYTITGFLNDQGLPEMYGAGAFPLSYPNRWDQKLGRSGSGIWLHGVPRDTYSRAPRSSEGCVTMANDDLVALKPYLQAGQTPVILADKLDWQEPSKLAAQREPLLKLVEAWRGRWSARDTEAYLGYYAANFSTDGMNRVAFAAHKRRVNAAKKRIDVKLRDLELFRYPGEENLVMAQFIQDYNSDNYAVSSRKQQYWKRQADGGWKIVLEESR
jgi:murein L,D-transpeptidase YafK